MISAMQKLFMELQNPFIKIEFTVECWISQNFDILDESKVGQ